MLEMVCGLVVAVTLSACMPEAIVQAEQRADALLSGGMLKSRQLFGDDYTIHYISRDGMHDSILVFIHGTPGDWRIFARQLENPALAGSAQLVALDRPGWGGSTIPKGETHIETDFSEQAKYISYLLVKLREQNGESAVVLVGHSLGATLATFIAMQYPQLVDGVVAIAGDLSSAFAEPKWYNKLASVGPVHALLPKDLCFANDEVVALPDNLDAMRPDWESLSVPLLVIQGEKDALVDPRNADFAEHLETQNRVVVKRLPDAGHLLLLMEADKVNAMLRKFMDEVAARG